MGAGWLFQPLSGWEGTRFAVLEPQVGGGVAELCWWQQVQHRVQVPSRLLTHGFGQGKSCGQVGDELHVLGSEFSPMSAEKDPQFGIPEARNEAMDLPANLMDIGSDGVHGSDIVQELMFEAQ